MGWWDSVTEWFGGAEAYDPYTDIYISPTPEPMPLEIGYIPSVPAAGYEYYDPAYGITEGPGTEPWYESLWGALSTTGKELLKSPLLPTLIKRIRGGFNINSPNLVLPRLMIDRTLNYIRPIRERIRDRGP